MISKVIIGSLLVAFVTAQRCDQGDTVCTKLESDDPIFQGQRCEVPGDCKGMEKKINLQPISIICGYSDSFLAGLNCSRT